MDEWGLFLMARKRRSKKKSNSDNGIVVVIMAVAILVIFLYQKVAENPEIIFAIYAAILIWLFYFIWKRNKNKLEREAYLEKLNKVLISDDRHDYVIKKDGYKRGNPIDRNYYKKYKLSLLSLYGNKCAKCGSVNNGIHLDHFVISKNEGGNFILQHKDGFLVNNSIPLCQSCNSSKGDRYYRDFFSDDEVLELFTKNKEMTLLVNSES